MIFADKIEKMYREQMFIRCDDNGTAYYFSADDFEGLNRESFVFKAKAGHNLQGYFYWYENPAENRVVIFEHGMGGGHRSYMREIETIAQKGYLVFAYDHTGCMESEGENTNGFGQSLSDLDCAVKALKDSEKCKGMDISIIGHSWGGFSTLNISALHPDIKHIVAMSGFISVKDMVNQYFAGLMKPFAKHIYALEEKSNPDTVKFNAVESLKDTKVKALVIHSADDPMVKKECHFDVLKNALNDKENITFWLMEGKAHSPNYTYDAVKYKDAFFATLTEKLKKKELETAQQKAEFVAGYDWWKMTTQDMDVWDRIFEFIKE
ncbi:MAG: alpha/beta fold hydrolase [Oscillospiraceae bacterium]|nr:alpha/beta fold hydrolase [Oscillospiraceae bacterium]